MNLATYEERQQESSDVLIGEIIGSVEVSCYTIPTDAPEADGTYRWHQTTLVAVHLTAGDKVAFGYTCDTLLQSWPDAPRGVLPRLRKNRTHINRWREGAAGRSVCPKYNFPNLSWLVASQFRRDQVC